MQTNYFLIFIISILLCTETFPQDLPRLSPAANVEQRIGLSWVTVSYSRPSTKGRSIWGDLVPFNKIWRTGANEATIIIFDDPVFINNTHVPMGQYTLYSTPQKDKVTFILSGQLTSWGDIPLDTNEKILEVTVPFKACEFTEQLSFNFKNVNIDTGLLCLRWAEKEACFTIKTDSQGKVLKNIENAINNSSVNDYQPLLRAISYSIDQGYYLDKLGPWSDMAIEKSKGAWDAIWTKATVFAFRGEFQQAIQWGERSLKKLEGKSDLADTKKILQSTIQQWKQNK